LEAADPVEQKSSIAAGWMGAWNQGPWERRAGAYQGWIYQTEAPKGVLRIAG
jgi:hypothetical protein